MRSVAVIKRIVGHARADGCENDPIPTLCDIIDELLAQRSRPMKTELEALDARIREARGSWGPDNDGANPVVRGMQEARLILRGEKLP